MKRSQHIKLVLLGTSLICSTACDDKKKHEEQYKNEQECLKIHPLEECHKAFTESRSKHATTAPKFTSKEECEKQYGADKCVTAPMEGQHEHSHGMFMPMMTGFMMGKMMGGGTPILPQAATSSGWGSSTTATKDEHKASTARGGFGSRSYRYSAGG